MNQSYKRMLQFAILIFGLCIWVACGGGDTSDPVVDQPNAETALASDTNVIDESELADAVEETVLDTFLGNADDEIDSEADGAMAIIEAEIDAQEDAAQNDAGTGGDASDDFDNPTLIQPGSYSGSASFGLEDLSLDMRDVYRVEAAAGDIVSVHLVNIQTELQTDFSLRDPQGNGAWSNLFEGDEGETLAIGLSDDGYVDIEITAQLYEFTVELAQQNDANSGGDAPDAIDAALSVGQGLLQGTLAGPRADGTPAQDCYAHAGAELTFSLLEQKPRPRLTARTFDASGTLLQEQEATQTHEQVLASEPAAAVVCFTAEREYEEPSMLAAYQFSLGEVAEAVVVYDFDGCGLLSAETVQNALALDTTPLAEPSTNGDCQYAFVDRGIYLSFTLADESELEFVKTSGGVEVSEVGVSAFYVDFGQGALMWTLDNDVWFALMGVDYTSGATSSEQLVAIAKQVSP
ncbi:MAG: hypothetical protein ACPG8W_15730 [Candidatus Promineifilaceae bacterium]